MSPIRWTLLMPDGALVEGEGQDAPAGLKLSTLAEDAMAGRFRFRDGPYIYVAGAVDLHWTIPTLIGYGPEARSSSRWPRSTAHA